MGEPMLERWLPVDVCPENYKISDLGQVWSRPRPRSRGGIMKQSTGQHGVKVVNLTVDGKQRVYLIHHLVLTAFVGPRPEGLEGCHNDGNPANNALTNLRWDTHEANVHDMIRHGTASFQNQTHCVNDHEYTPENTGINSKGARYCRECARTRSREFWRAKHARQISMK